MFDFGFAEMLVIGVVALLVIGPERLPSVARTVGSYVGRIRRFVNNVRSDVEREFRTDELQRMLREQQDELNSLKETINEKRKDADLGSIKQEVENTIADFNKTFVEDAQPSSDKSAEPPAKPEQKTSRSDSGA
jgi:sec-independent protein translocase protein TatB